MDLVAVLQKMGAIISVDVDRTFRIEGVKELKGYTHTSLTDRIEAASWASAALATHGDIFVKGATQPEMMTFLNVFRKIGGEFDITDKGIRIWHPGGDLNPVAIETDVHPGFMTDWQQPLVVALTQAKGLSIVHETVYENRFGFTKPLVQMGATVQLYRECLGSLPCRFQQRNYKHSAVIFGAHAVDRSRHRCAGSARRLQPPDCGARGLRPVERARHLADRPRLRRFPRQARRPRRRRGLIVGR